MRREAILRSFGGVICIVLAFIPAQIAFFWLMWWVVPAIIPGLGPDRLQQPQRLATWQSNAIALGASLIATILLVAAVKLLFGSQTVFQETSQRDSTGSRQNDLRRWALVFKAYIGGYIIIFPVWLYSMPGHPGQRGGPDTEALFWVALGVLISGIVLIVTAIKQRLLPEAKGTLCFAVAGLYLFADALHYALGLF